MNLAANLTTKSLHIQPLFLESHAIHKTSQHKFLGMNPSNHSQMQCQRLKLIPRRQEATLKSHTYIQLIIKNLLIQLNTQPKLLFWKTEPNEPVGPVSQPVHPVERSSQNFSRPSSQGQESNKTNRVQFRFRMSENRHKQRKIPKPLFLKTKPNEPVGLVSRPVHPVEEKPQIWLENSLKNKETKKNKLCVILRSDE